MKRALCFMVFYKLSNWTRKNCLYIIMVRIRRCKTSDVFTSTKHTVFVEESMDSRLSPLHTVDLDGNQEFGHGIIV